MLYISKQECSTREDVLKLYPNEKVILEDKNFWKIPVKSRTIKRVWTSCGHAYTDETPLRLLYKLSSNTGLCCICRGKVNKQKGGE